MITTKVEVLEEKDGISASMVIGKKEYSHERESEYIIETSMKGEKGEDNKISLEINRDAFLQILVAMKRIATQDNFYNKKEQQ